MFRWIQMISEESEQYGGYKKELVFPWSGYHYKWWNPNEKYNDVVDLVEYHVDTLPQFQYIVYKSGEKGNFGGWLGISTKLRESPLIFLGQYEAIFKWYIFTKKLWTYKGKCRLVPKGEGYLIIILTFQSR